MDLTILRACRTYAPLVNQVGTLDSANLLAAMAMKESSIGDNLIPRYEPRYDVGGIYSENPQQARLLRMYGRAAACSYGPLQAMLVNLPGFAPPDLIKFPLTALRGSLQFLNQQIAKFNPKTVQDIGQIWNGGHIGASVPQYVESLEDYYDRAGSWYSNLDQTAMVNT